MARCACRGEDRRIGAIEIWLPARRGRAAADRPVADLWALSRSFRSPYLSHGNLAPALAGRAGLVRPLARRPHHSSSLAFGTELVIAHGPSIFPHVQLPLVSTRSCSTRLSTATDPARGIRTTFDRAPAPDGCGSPDRGRHLRLYAGLGYVLQGRGRKGGYEYEVDMNMKKRAPLSRCARIRCSGDRELSVPSATSPRLARGSSARRRRCRCRCGRS
jgi:hypothetical protein